MGYSATQAAFSRLEELMKKYGHGPCSNEYSPNNGKARYFQEVGEEQPSGAIVGSVSRFSDESRSLPVGDFRIEPNGIVTRFPGIPKKEIGK